MTARSEDVPRPVATERRAGAAIAPQLLIAPVMAEEEAAAWITDRERARARQFAPSRRRQWMTWRAILRRKLAKWYGDEAMPPSLAAARFGIDYDPAGAPVVEGCDVHISVAHCPERVAVAVSPERCAVDIEPEGRDFGRAAARYMTERERALSDDPLLPGAVWCAKETLYKYAGRPGLDLLRDLHVERVDFAACTVLGRIGEEPPLELSLERREGFLVVSLFG